MNLEEFNNLYTNKDPNKNMIIADKIQLDLNAKKTRIFNNVLVIGGAGTGKTENFVKPNILKANCSYIIHDPVGYLYQTTSDVLKKEGYDIQVLDLSDIENSKHYNPFYYLEFEDDVKDMVDCIIKNYNISKNINNPFFEKYESAFLLALCFYVIEKMPENKQNFTSVIKLINECEIKKDDSEHKNNIDILMDELEKENPKSNAVRYWKIFRIAPNVTAMSVLVSVGVKLSGFNTPTMKQLTSKNDFYLENIGNKKTAIFVINSVNEDNSFITSLFFSQVMKELENILSSSKPYKPFENHVQFVFDEFPNIGIITNLLQKINGACWKDNVGYSFIIQSLSQLQNMYKNEWEELIDACPNVLIFNPNQVYSTHQSMIDFFVKKYTFEITYNYDIDCIYFLRGKGVFCCNKYDGNKQ